MPAMRTGNGVIYRMTITHLKADFAQRRFGWPSMTNVSLVADRDR